MATTSFQGGGYPGQPYGSFVRVTPPPVVITYSGGSTALGGGKKIRLEEYELFQRIDREIKRGRKLDHILADLEKPEEYPARVITKKSAQEKPAVIISPPKTQATINEVRRIAEEIAATRGSFEEFQQELRRLLETQVLREQYEDEASLLLLLAGVM